MKRNLISLGLLEKKGFHFSSGDGKMKVFKGNNTFMMAKRVNNMYYLDAEVINDEVNVTKNVAHETWACR